MKHILIVEDDVKVQNLYRDALVAKGYAVAVAADVAQARSELQKQVPDLVLLDIMLPGGTNGFDLMERMHQDPRYNAIKVIVVTNLDSEEKTARAIGVVDYLVKPNVSLEQIVARVETALK